MRRPAQRSALAATWSLDGSVWVLNDGMARLRAARRRLLKKGALRQKLRLAPPMGHASVRNTPWRQ
jgi:hypothetical protein